MGDPQGPRILTVDIETAPALADIWGLFDQNVNLKQVRDAVRVMCFAAKWHHQKQVLFASEYHDGHETMIRRAHELMSQADVLVTYNGKSFDVKHLHREFLLLGLDPPAPHKDVDLLSVVRSRFKFTSTKLDHVAEQLGIGDKGGHKGFDTWRGCMEGDPKAWADMRRYNVQDVRLTEKVYDRMRPWIKGHPNVALYDGTAGDRVEACGRCGSTHRQRRGYYYTDVRVYPKYQCQGCGGWSRGKGHLVGVNVRPVA